MKVRKREGYLVDFDKQKIISAISKAGQVSDEIKNRIADYIENVNKDIIDVEEIQDIVERKLMTSSYKDVAKAYINYRYLHKLSRDKYKELMDIVSEKLGAKNVQNQNANIDEYSFGGRVGEMSDAIMKKYALDYIVSETSKNNHLNNEVYIHDLGHYPLGDHNCFNRNTKFITKQGVKSFSDFKDGSVVEILCMDGVWRVATVHMYGKQNMQKVTLSRCGKSVDVVCTKNHRWILSDSSVTDDLKVGDRLFCLNSSVEDFSTDYDFRKAEMFCLGFIIGDGCDHKNKITVRLCGDKTKYAPIFEKALYNRIKVKDSSDCIYSSKKGYFKQSFLTNHMWRLLSFEDKVALFTGYLCADGSQTTNTKIVWTSDERVLAMIKEISCLAGYHIFDIKRKTSSTNFMVDRTLYKVVFTVQYSNNSTWVVTNIKNLRSKQEAWCVSEPVTKSFTLDGGIITGNCLSIPFDDLLANGFNTRQTDVRPAKSVNTAFQLVAVLFQLQSLQQFGGVSATHLDWTMVPYVRLSFAKHFSNGLHYCEDAPYSTDAIGLAIKPIRTPRDVSIEDGYYTIYPKAYKYAVDMTTKEVKQAVEGMYHNLNTLQSRSGNQLPFTSVNYGTCTLPEGRMIIKALLDVSIEGIGKLHKTSIFPCGIFKCKKGINLEKGDANYDLFQLALKSTSLRLYPNYANCDNLAQLSYVDKDLEERQQIIDQLTEQEKLKLAERIKENPSIAKFLKLEVVD